ncbi:VirK/YbjX family protein [Celerinatantimonas sp. YJH-8]|uniref:VirK/YbjX family protein n=1 Tax=Celerinatantimonas sp. YJH-8 TaxID=3228714 RepID=UPI0038C4C03A
MIVSLALQACPPRSKHRLKRSTKFIVKAIIFHRYFKQMVQYFAYGERSLLLRKQSRYLMKCMVPYLHIGLSKQAIIDLLKNHYNWLETTFSPEICHQIYTGDVKLFEFTLNEQPFYLSLSYEGKVRKEGELALCIKNTLGEKYYTAAVTYQNKSLYIGCIQGSRHDDGFSSEFTKAFFGIRPKAFMVTVIQQLAQALSIEHIYAVKNDTHIYNAKRYHGKAARFNLNYDQLWEELNGHIHDQWLYELPVITVERDLSEIKRSRRKTYRQRYEWLHDFYHQLIVQLDMMRVMPRPHQDLNHRQPS